MKTETVCGSDIRLGDALSGLWFAKGCNVRVVSLEPYNGPLSYLWGGKGKARIAGFDVGPGMTIEPDAQFERVSP